MRAVQDVSSNGSEAARRLEECAVLAWARPGVSGDAAQVTRRTWRATEIGGGGTAVARSNRKHAIVRALNGDALPHDGQRVDARDCEVPSGGAVGTARAIACAYSVFATGGRELRLRRETLDLLAAPAVPPTRGFYDECMKRELQFSLGFMKPSRLWPFGSQSAFGFPGAGGSLGFADPVAKTGYAYVTSQLGRRLTADPREVALKDAVHSAVRVRERRAALTSGAS